jgi:predicted 3-demethylubiquinone-9 3-methyltransferase (glyoxalase superfamily)
MFNSVSTHLMFFGAAGDAMELYQSLFNEFKIQESIQYGDSDGDMAGKIKTAKVKFADHDLIIIDSPPVHDFTFTPAMSLFVDFEDAAELGHAFTVLSNNGQVYMPLDNYGFSPRFGWVQDRFGLSWQLNLKAEATNQPAP